MDFAAGLFTGIAFWPMLIFIVWIAGTVVLVENEEPFWALVLMIIAGVAVTFTSDFNPFLYVYENPVKVVGIGIGYVAAGIAYAYYRWDRHVTRWRREYEALPEGLEKRRMFHNKPHPGTSKEKLIGWMAYWPWSAFWHVCADFIRDAYEWLYRKVSTMFVHLTEKRLAGLAPPAPEPEEESRNGRHGARRLSDVLPPAQGGVDHPAA